jgi:uncharacterized protein (TIRG00374 family)
VAWLLRLVVSLAALVVIFQLVPIAQVWAEARRVAPTMWLGALGLFLLGHAAAAAKWRLLIGPGVSFRQAFRAHLAGLAANLCLPGLAGGDVVRAGLVFRTAEDGSRLVVGSIADRLLDVFGLLILAWVGAVVALRQLPGDYAMLRGLLVASVVGLALIFPVSLFLDRSRERRAFGGSLPRPLARAVSATASLARRPRRLVLCLAISLAVQTMFVGINIALAAAVQLDAPVAAWFFAWSTAKIVAIAPVSLGGLGVREAAMAHILSTFGADPAQVVAIGLIWQTLLFASGLIGVLAQVVWKPDPAKAAATAARGAREERTPSRP